MKLEKLQHLENEFFKVYPEGFDAPDLQEIAKKHKMDKMQTFVKENFAKDKFESTEEVFEDFVKLISKSSLVSVFEKTKFRNEAKIMTSGEKEELVAGIYAFLYGNQAQGFAKQLAVLQKYKMAKWPILTVLGLYMNPNHEVLVKPTTVKGILKYFEVEEFQYTSKANYAFYDAYRQFINEIKSEAGEHLHIDNAAFCGFLMMSIES
ncbi:hypothetical protein [Fusibacter sp. JL216-2]|uniref:hypothetical protein n=1 Tax=Fusibacter sp. JL216-2 TaxID=3071453 RepID=UPI003D33B6BF